MLTRVHITIMEDQIPTFEFEGNWGMLCRASVRNRVNKFLGRKLQEMRGALARGVGVEVLPIVEIEEKVDA